MHRLDQLSGATRRADVPAVTFRSPIAELLADETARRAREAREIAYELARQAGDVTAEMVKRGLAASLEADRREVQDLLDRARSLVASLDLPAKAVEGLKRRLKTAERSRTSTNADAQRARDVLRALVVDLERIEDSGVGALPAVPIEELRIGYRRVVELLLAIGSGWATAKEIEVAFRGGAESGSKASTIVNDLRGRYHYDVLSPTTAGERGLSVPKGVKNSYRLA